MCNAFRRKDKVYFIFVALLETYRGSVRGIPRNDCRGKVYVELNGKP